MEKGRRRLKTACGPSSPRKGQFHRTDRVESGRESSPVDPISLVYRNLKKLRGIWNLGSTGGET
ncbi:uncharacterized protein BO88DRAFT_402122 [Aspergillus vadensis CBS 113365]|uniref:Uncharacterized protein n=1 Tax=Aspergillus vadensis (strain CBS 113365 / IMI 142717 / IBT 24658) TaxID=1448311 RepID=A0A319BPI7_ASPVC|nr:hypothetical protein BO88DRAFT_402122 [Aspergillus vadensis CBS 113365]PYH73070.1 hypothetical protein BO88DRAFT_402122 [Aspergillus vadensis CBS 113365]